MEDIYKDFTRRGRLPQKPYAVHKPIAIRRGPPGDDIYSDFTMPDRQEKIKNYLQKNFQTRKAKERSDKIKSYLMRNYEKRKEAK